MHYYTIKYTYTLFLKLKCLSRSIYNYIRTYSIMIYFILKQTPFLPYIPCLSIAINIFLCFQFSGFAWLRLSIWIILGEYCLLALGECTA